MMHDALSILEIGFVRLVRTLVSLGRKAIAQRNANVTNYFAIFRRVQFIIIPAYSVVSLTSRENSRHMPALIFTQVCDNNSPIPIPSREQSRC